MNDTIYAYLAGVIDSDGYIGVAIRHNKHGWQDTYQSRIQVKQVETAAIDLFYDTFAGHRYQQGPSTKRGRPLWTWGVHSAAAVRVLVPLRPFLRIKGAQADNALAVAAVNARRERSFGVPAFVPGDAKLGCGVHFSSLSLIE